MLGIISGGLFYGDAIITPALSVLSAIEGLKVATPALDDFVGWLRQLYDLEMPHFIDRNFDSPLDLVSALVVVSALLSTLPSIRYCIRMNLAEAPKVLT